MCCMSEKRTGRTSTAQSFEVISEAFDGPLKPTLAAGVKSFNVLSAKAHWTPRIAWSHVAELRSVG